MARIIVSSGHTSSEPGAIFEDLREVDIVKKIASKVVSALRDKGIITLAVPAELDLDARIDWINKSGYTADSQDICIEIHVNEGKKSGIEGWYRKDPDDLSKILTEKILENACKKISVNNEGAKDEATHPLKTLQFLSQTKPIGSIIECLYIDNPDDQVILRDDAKLAELSQGIVEGIFTFLDPDYKPEVIQKPVQAQPREVVPNFPGAPAQMFREPYPTFNNWTSQDLDQDFSASKTPDSKNLSREDRKKMIKELYSKLLGREISDQDLNYFVNLGLDENQMTKRIIESQEHSDAIKNSQEFVKLKPVYDQLVIDNERTKAALKDKEAIIIKLNELISMKAGTENIQPQTPAPSTTNQFENPNKSEFFSSIKTDSIPVPETFPVMENTVPKNQPFVQTDARTIEKEKKQGFFDKILSKLNDIFE